jgi:hypothetical protein
MAILGFDISQVFRDVTTPNEKDFFTYNEGLDEKTKKDIDTLFKILVSDSAAQIIANAATSISLGKKIAIIHPFTGWEYILSNPERKESLKTLFAKYQEDQASQAKGWFDFISNVYKIDDKILKISRQKTVEGFPVILRTRHKLGHLEKHIEEFCYKLNLDKNHITALINENNFEEFLKTIIFN